MGWDGFANCMAVHQLQRMQRERDGRRQGRAVNRVFSESFVRSCPVYDNVNMHMGRRGLRAPSLSQLSDPPQYVRLAF